MESVQETESPKGTARSSQQIRLDSCITSANMSDFGSIKRRDMAEKAWRSPRMMSIASHSDISLDLELDARKMSLFFLRTSQVLDTITA